MSEPLVVLEGASAREAPIALAPTSTVLDAGAHAALGTREDGVGLFLATIAGRTRLRAGSVRVLGGAPADHVTRRAIAYVPREVALPEVLRVGEVLDMAASMRGEPPSPARARLDVLGIGELEPRKVRSLTQDEARAVALAEAVTANAGVILVDEPYASMDPRAASRVAEVLRRRAAEGACVVVATASPREASELADDHLVFERGVLVRRATALADVMARGAGPARLRVVVDLPRRFLAALATETAATALEADARSVVLVGPDAIALAEAAARAAIRANVEVESLRAEAPALEELRASAAGEMAAAYQAALDRARAGGPAAPPAPAGPPAGAPS